MSKAESNTVGNVAIGLAVVVLGFVAYRMFAGSSAVTYTGTAPTAAQNANAANLAKQVATGTSGLLSWLSSSGSAGNPSSSLAGSLSGVLGGATGSTQLDQTYTSTGYNPDEISSDIASYTAASMASAGESDLDIYGFSL